MKIHGTMAVDGHEEDEIRRACLICTVSLLTGRIKELEGAARHLIGCWETEVPSHTLYAGFDNMRAVLDAPPSPPTAEKKP